MTEPQSEFLNHKQTCARYGHVSHMWICRRQLDAGFPLPIFMGRQKFWKVADLVAWEKTQANKPPRVIASNLQRKAVA